MQAGAIRPRTSAKAPAGRPGAGRETSAHDARTRARGVHEYVGVAARQGCGYNAGPVTQAFDGTRPEGPSGRDTPLSSDVIPSCFGVRCLATTPTRRAAMLTTRFGHRLAAWLLLALLVGASGCGQKGDLYIPDEPESRQDLQAR